MNALWPFMNVYDALQLPFLFHCFQISFKCTVGCIEIHEHACMVYIIERMTTNE